MWRNPYIAWCNQSAEYNWQNKFRKHGLLAQLGERMGHNHDVVGSSPAQTINKNEMDTIHLIFCYIECTPGLESVRAPASVRTSCGHPNSRWSKPA